MDFLRSGRVAEKGPGLKYRSSWGNAMGRHGEIRTLFECSNFPKFEQIFQNSFEQFEHIVVVRI